MTIFVERTEKQCYGSLFSSAPFQFPSWAQGTVVPLEICIVDRIQQTFGTQIFQPIDASAYEIKAALGNGYIQPIAGSFILRSGIDQTSGALIAGKRYEITTFVAGDDLSNIGADNANGSIFTATGTTPATWTHGSIVQECTSNIAFSASVSDIQTTLNACHFISTAGGVTVAEQADGLFVITWNDAGSQIELVGNGEGLAPLSLVDNGTLIDGTSQVSEVQSFRLIQNPGAFLDLSGTSSEASVTCTQLVQGGDGANAKWKLTIDSRAYAGAFTLMNMGYETGLLPFNIGDTNLATALAALTSVGAGNVTVSEVSPSVYIVEFIAGKANTDVGAITSDASALLVPLGKTGNLDLRTASLDLILGGALTQSIRFEIRGNPSGENEDYLYVGNHTLISSIIPPLSSTENGETIFATQAEVDAGTSGTKAVTPQTLKNAAQWAMAGRSNSFIPKNTSFTAAAGKSYLVDASAGSFNVTLPAVTQGGSPITFLKADNNTSNPVRLQASTFDGVDVGGSYNLLSGYLQLVPIGGDAGWRTTTQPNSAPISFGSPTITSDLGGIYIGSTLTAVSGPWTGYPTAAMHSFQWYTLHDDDQQWHLDSTGTTFVLTSNMDSVRVVDNISINGVPIASSTSDNFTVSALPYLAACAAHWSFDNVSGVWKDDITGRVLTVNNTVTTTPGIIGNAASFAGDGGYLTTDFLPPSVTSDNPQYTFAWWTKGGIAVSSNPASGMALNVTTNTPGDPEGTFWQLGSSSYNSANQTVPVDLVNPQLVVVRGINGGDAGMTVMGQNGNSGGISYDGDIDGGNWNGGLTINPQNLPGWIDEIAIWNRQLTDNEITALYNGGAGKAYPFN